MGLDLHLLSQLPVAVVLCPGSLRDNSATAHVAQLAPVGAVTGVAVQMVAGYPGKATLVGAGHLLEETGGGVEEVLGEWEESGTALVRALDLEATDGLA